MASFLTAAAAAIGSSSIGSALVRILVAYGISRLINKGAGQTAGTPDAGSRLQVSPDTTNPIPVLFGSAFYGGRITDAQLVDQNKTMWYCLTLSEVSGLSTRLSDNAAVKTNIDKVYLDNQLVTFKSDGITIDYITNEAEGTVNTSYRDLIQIYLYEKGSFAPTLPSNFLSGGLPISPAVLPGDARTLFPDWTDNHRMAGLTFALVKIAYNRDKGVTGLPEFQFQVSNNLNKPGDAIYAYMRNSISGADLPASAIDNDSLIALNDYADDSVNYFDESDGTTKTLANRYQINGIINPSDNVLANLQKLAANTGCFLNYDIALGKWGVVINRDTSVSLHFDDSNIISGIDLTGTNLDNLYNSVKVEFPHREIRDRIDSITIDLPTEFRNANEPNNELSIKLDLLNEPLQARELAYLELYQNRMDQMVTFTTDYSKINAEAGDVISITNSVYSWTNKPFRIVRVREIESEEGSLAVEIVAQEYDATMYSAGGVPRRPRVPSNPIDIPDISIVGTPAAPTYVAHNNIAVPYISLTGVVPGGIVDRFEFWGSSTAGYADSTFTLLGTLSNSNGSPYSQGNSLTYSADKLPAGTYKFKVRAGNEKAYGSYSPLSTEFTWAPVQVTDQVTDQTTIGGSMSDLIGPLAMGAVAYFAYQALYPEIMKALGDSELGAIFGIPSSAVQEMKNAAGNFKLIQVGDVIQTPYNNDTITFIAGDGIEITAEADAGTITITNTGSGSGGGGGSNFSKVNVNGTEVVAEKPQDTLNIVAGSGIDIVAVPGTDTITITNSAPAADGGTPPEPVITTATLPGSVLPNIYGTGDVAGITKSRLGIFTHDYLVFGTSEASARLREENIVTAGDSVKPNVNGVAASNYRLASLYDWTYNSTSKNFDLVPGYKNSIWGGDGSGLGPLGTYSNADHTAGVVSRQSGPAGSDTYAPVNGLCTRIYYTTCTYNPALALNAQAWGPWKLCYYTDTSVTTYTDNYTNPVPEAITNPVYRVDRELEYEGVVPDTDGPGLTNYDSFKPNVNVPIATTTNVRTFYPETEIIVEAGKLVAFGVCAFKFPDNTTYANNTIFGSVNGALDFQTQLNLTMTAYNGTNKYVAISDQAGGVYYGTDGNYWTQVENGKVTFLNTGSNYVTNIFKIVAYGGATPKFFVWDVGGEGGGCAYSTDGENWTEAVSNVAAGVTFIAWAPRSARWVATSPTKGYQSTDGITWTEILTF